MKKPEAFDAKRKTRDKALKRWIKSRDIVAPAIITFMCMGAVLGGILGHALIPELWTLGLFFGMATGVIGGSFYVTAQLSK